MPGFIFFHFLNVFWAKMFLCLQKYQAKSDGNDNSGQSHTSINFMVIDLEYFARKKKIAILKKKKIIFKRGKLSTRTLIYVQFKLNSNIFINVVAFMIGIIPIKRRTQPNVFLKSIHMNHWTNPPFSQCTRTEKRYIKMMLNTSFPASKTFLNDQKKPTGDGRG